MGKKLERSNKAHENLRRKWGKKGNTDKNRAFSNYHADCVSEQNSLGRVLTKNERRKLFKYWWDDEVNNTKPKYPKFKK